MNKELLLQQDQQSVFSFDSSEFCSIVSMTASIDSINMQRKQNQQLKTPPRRTCSIDEVQTQKTLSIQKPRFQQISQKPFDQHSPSFELGFVFGKNKQNVVFGQSKLKKVKNFFDQQENTFNDDFFPNHSLFSFPDPKPTQFIRQQMNQFSIPCFKNMGKKNQIQIDQNLLQKAKNFFNDDFDEVIKLPSFKKPTKIKKGIRQIQMQSSENFIKTVNVNKHKKRQNLNLVKKKEIFDWKKFQISNKKMFTKYFNYIQSSSRKKSSDIKSKKKNKQKIFESLKLTELDTDQFKNKNKMQIFRAKKVQGFSQTFFHQASSCQIIKCLLCDLKVKQFELTFLNLLQLFSDKLVVEKIDQDRFTRFYEQIYFKLLKYETFYPDIINKRLNASNILVQMHKKFKIVSSESPHIGWLELCLKQSKFYHSFVAEVRQIYHNQKNKTYFILLSDGWTNVWSIVTEKNSLYKFIIKLSICSKLLIGYWKFYSLANVLSFCPLSKQGEKCIQIWYNSSIVVKENLRLGKPKNMIFYRPLNLNRKQGGLLPTVQGTVVRMFCPSNSSKKSSYSTSQCSFNQNFVQIVTPEGFTVLIKFILPSDRSLAQLLRLYFKYQFYFLKIGTKDNMLQFNDQYSKFFEFEKKQKNSYEIQLIEILKKRFINSMNFSQLKNKLRIGNLYDIYLRGLKEEINGVGFQIENYFENERQNQNLKGKTCLFQQYQLIRIEKSHQQQLLQIFLKKSKFSSTLKTLPSIYQNINK